MMTKVYIFLIFMVLILPSLGLTRYTWPPPALNSESGAHLESTVPRRMETVLEWGQSLNTPTWSPVVPAHGFSWRHDLSKLENNIDLTFHLGEGSDPGFVHLQEESLFK